MPVIAAADAPIFALEGTTITGLAAPSRGSSEISSWKVHLDAEVRVPSHVLTREEVFVVLQGAALATLDGEEILVGAGDALMVPPGVPFSLSVASGGPFEAICSMGVGGQAAMVDGEEPPFAPPWSV
jgi:mannose-6-phosphate isomerase-like protein (cupin superfamily)